MILSSSPHAHEKRPRVIHLPDRDLDQAWPRVVEGLDECQAEPFGTVGAPAAQAESLRQLDEIGVVEGARDQPAESLALHPPDVAVSVVIEDDRDDRYAVLHRGR